MDNCVVGLEPALRGRPATEPFTLGDLSKPLFQIEFPDGFTHRVRNFAEALYREVDLAGRGRVKDIDRSTTLVTIELSKRKHFADVRELVDEELERHGFVDIAQVKVSR